MSLDAIKTFIIWLATGTEGIAGLVIAAAVIEVAIRTAPRLRYSRTVSALMP